MIRAITMAVLAGGIPLTIFGVNAMHSANADISRFFTGAPDDRTIWMLVGGIVMMVAGLAGVVRPGKN